MTAIWQDDGEAWRLLSPVGFPAEAALHDLVAQTPEMLPLAGSPRLAVLGREVQLGSGYADVLAIEENGRLAVIEIKLARNSEARRAVVAQVLAYAAHLHGMDIERLERTLARDLAGGTISDAVAPLMNDLRDWAEVEEGLRASLAQGWFRLVLVLDEAPDDLIRLVGYLEGITNEHITVDLVTVASYAVNGTRGVIPQRIESRYRETAPPTSATRASASQPSAPIVHGAAEFEEFYPEIVPEHREKVVKLANWAKRLEAEGHARLRTTVGSNRRVLRVEVPGEDAGIVAIWGEKRRPGVSFHMRVAARRSPISAEALRQMLPDAADPYVGIDEVTDELLSAAAAAYQEAASGRLAVSSSQD